MRKKEYNINFFEFINSFKDKQSWDLKDLRIYDLFLKVENANKINFSNLDDIKTLLKNLLINEFNIYESIEEYFYKGIKYHIKVSNINIFYKIEEIFSLNKFLNDKNIEILRFFKRNSLLIKFKNSIFLVSFSNNPTDILFKSFISCKLINTAWISCVNLKLSFHRLIRKLLSLDYLKNFLKRKIKFLFWMTLNLFGFKKKANNFRYKKLEYLSFLNLSFKDKNELNSLLRDSHFRLITNNYKLITISEIINWFSNPANIDNANQFLLDPIEINLGDFPRYLDRKFWDNGNSQFFNCMFFGFRKGIAEYNDIKDIKDNAGNIYFSKKYYQSFPEMKDKDIEKMLCKSPILIVNNSISSGRHRVAAMIGRLIKGKDYIPFILDTLN